MRTRLLVPLAFLLLTGLAPAHGATFLVNQETYPRHSYGDTSDASPGDGTCADANGRCTLRAAIEEANAYPGPDVIRFQSIIYNEPARSYHITDDVTIESASARYGIDGPDSSVSSVWGNYTDGLEPLFVNSATAAFLDVDLSPGPAGAIRNDGTLTLTRCDVFSIGAEKPSPAIENAGTLTVDRSVVARNRTSGAAILNLGTLTVVDSTLQENTAGGACGAIDNRGVGTLVNSTVSGNSASTAGGGICNRQGGVLELSSSTVTDNTAPNGAGIRNEDAGSAVTIRNTIVAGNNGPDCQDDGAATVVVRGGNIFGTGSLCAVTGPGSVISAAPALGPLQFNSRLTRTHAPLPGSPAIDAADPATPGTGGDACPAADQGGVARPDGPRCDIGAVEGPELPCPPSPRTRCATTRENKSPVRLRPGRVIWHWQESPFGFDANFGDPATTTAYRLCLYDRPAGSPRLFAALLVRGGGTCGTRPCWTPFNFGRNPAPPFSSFRYTDPAAASDGVRRMSLNTRGLAERSIKLRAQGAAVAALPFPLTPAVTVQLLNSNGYCWRVEYSTHVQKNTPTDFSARSDP